MEKESKYLVKLQGTETYSMIGFMMWTEQKEHAKHYTGGQALDLISSIPEHIGIGKLVDVEKGVQ